MSLFDPDDRDRAVSRALMIGSMLDATDPVALVAGLALANNDDLARELMPYTNALMAAQLAYRGISRGTRLRIADPRREARIATVVGLLEGADRVNPVPFGGHVDVH